MTLLPIEQEILTQLHKLALPQQREVLAFVRMLTTTPRGVPGQELLSFAGMIDQHDIALLKHAIESGCEQVDLNEW